MALEEDDVPGSSTGTRSRRTSRRSPWARCVPRPDRRRRRRRRCLRAAGFRRAPPARRLGVNRLVLAAGVIHRHPFSVSAIEAAQERVRVGVMMWEGSCGIPARCCPAAATKSLVCSARTSRPTSAGPLPGPRMEYDALMDLEAAIERVDPAADARGGPRRRVVAAETATPADLLVNGLSCRFVHVPSVSAGRPPTQWPQCASCCL
jgi:hypothetical protein